MRLILSSLGLTPNSIYKPYRLYGNEKESCVKAQILGRLKGALGSLRHNSKE
jgi:hypothetical protein